MIKKKTVKNIWKTFKYAGSDFIEHNVFKMSASLAYYTIFSLGPMLLVIIYLSSVFLSKGAIEGTLYEQIKGLIGPGSAAQIQEIIKSTSISGDSKVTAIIGFVTLLIGATTVFADMQDSLNTIWNLKIKPTKNSWAKLIINRLLSFSVLVGLGFILLVSLVLNGLMDGLMERLKLMFPDMAVFMAYVLNVFITLIVTSFLFGIIFKVLPDALIKWKDVFVGAIFTGVLFMLGRFLISLYIGKTDVGSTYGAAGSIIVLMVWIYFSSIIVFFGAEFTKSYALNFGEPIQPDKYAVTVSKAEIETGNKSIQENEKDKVRTEEKLQKEEDKKNPSQ